MEEMGDIRVEQLNITWSSSNFCKSHIKIDDRRSISCNKCPTLLGDVDNKGSCACVRAEGIWEMPIPSPQFCCEL